MNKKARIALWGFLAFTLIILISIMYFVFAAHTVTPSTFNVNEDIGFVYNITVNNTDAGQAANITQVNITLWGNFNFVANSNGTDALGNFVNTSTVLSWTNSTGYLINGSQWKYFWFNATASTPGNYNITVTTLNATGAFSSNISVTVNDTTYPIISIVSPLAQNYTTTIIEFNISVTENINTSWCGFSLDGATNVTMTRFNDTYFNYTNSSMSQRAHSIVFACNDTSGNMNASSGTRAFGVDSIYPVINLISPTDGNTSINPLNIPFTFNVTDASVTNCSLILNGAIWNFNSSVNVTGGTTTFTNTTYTVSNTWSVNCTDNANNKANSSLWSFSVLSFQFNGTAKDENGNALNNSVINVTIRNQQFTALAYTSGNSNASGWFNFSIASNSSWMYESSILHRNGSVVDFKSKSIPAFQSQMIQQLSGAIFYLTPAGTINITAINSSGNRVPFQYQVKDTKLGYTIAEDHQNYANELIVYVPKNRNYSIMIYPNQSMPVSYNWNNFSSTASYNTSLMSYNHTISTLQKTFNLTMTMARVTGYITNASGYPMNATLITWTNFTVIPYLLEPGNMIHSEYGDMPYNLSAAGSPPDTDLYNLTSGFFNISLPATTETSTIIMFATLVNGTNYYGGFRNISLSYPTNSATINISVYGLLGDAGNITMDVMGAGPGGIAIPTKKQTFNLVNTTNSSLTQTQAHIETTVDYSSYGALEFTWMSDVAQSQATASFSLPLLNITGIKEMNVFVSGGSGNGSQYAPRRVSTMTAAQISANPNITIKNFNPQDINGALATSQISIALFISNSTCDVPSPAISCYIGGTSQTMATFNPMQAVMGGGKISFRMGYGSILIHYVNVDMLASGPPDALFENDAGTSESSSTFSNAVKFGSQGPSIYDYVLVSLPYVEGSNSTTGLNENADINIAIPTFYDDNWNAIWSSSNGTNASALAGNYSHYSTHQSEWQTLMSSNNCTSNVSVFNSTNPCYKDTTTSNRIWIRLPHFSGTGPTVTGSLITAAATTPPSTAGGGTTGAAANKTKSYSWIKITPGAATIWKLVDKDLGIKQISITVNNPAQNVKITVTKYDGKPAEVTKEKSGKVYKYLKIEEKNLGKNLSKAILTIQVEKSWLTNKSLTKDKIAVSKFDNSSSDWKELTTTYKEEDTTNYYYDTELTSFSYFAIAEKIVVAPTCTPSWSCTDWSACQNETRTRTCTDSNTCGTNEGKPAETQDCKIEGKAGKTYLWIIAIIIIIVVVILWLLIKKRKY